MSRLGSSSGMNGLGSFLRRLHDDGWIVTLCLLTLVVMGGFWSLWRASVQEQMIRDMRSSLIKTDDMLTRRTDFFERIEGNQKRIMDDIASMLKDQNQKFDQIFDHIRREELQWKATHDR